MSTQMVKGNTAVIIGALYAGCDCFFGYPITPASEILHEASKYFPMLGRKFVQAESEEASVNMIYGGASTGHRVMSAGRIHLSCWCGIACSYCGCNESRTWTWKYRT